MLASQKKIIVLCGPSGAGKTSMARALLQHYGELSFSISATTRPRRSGELEGVDYYFLNTSAFKQKIDRGDFLEYEEVYEGLFYGTLKDELRRIWEEDHVPVLDVDVNGAMEIRGAQFCEGLFIFVHPGDVETLRNRLQARHTESGASLQRRLARAEMELEKAAEFGQLVYNDNFERARKQIIELVGSYIGHEVERR